jgi:hypothetical protein
MRRQWYRNKSIILKILVLFLVSRILLTAVGLGSTIYSSHNFNYTGGSFWKYSESKILDIWGIWDTGYYLDIAKRGYSTNLNFEFPVKPPNNPAFAEHETNYAFFPLYSMLIKAVTFATKDYFVSGLLISNTLLLFSAFFLYKLTKVLFDSQTAKKSVYFLFLFPTSFVLSGVFTESTILFCLVLSCYLMERKKWLLSGVVAAFASLTKITGILVTSIFLIRYGIKPINKQRILSIILPFVFILLLFYYQYTKSGDFLIFFHTEALGWGTKLTNPFLTVFVYLLSIHEPTFFTINIIIILIYIVTEVFLLIYSYKKIPYAYWVFWFLVFLSPLISGDTVSTSISRQAVYFFPQYFALSLLTKNNVIFFLICSLLAILQIIFMALWVNGIGLI